ncbi:hypothetical protein LXL04_003988 [Taraxacum kok-saghyz]
MQGKWARACVQRMMETELAKVRRYGGVGGMAPPWGAHGHEAMDICRTISEVNGGASVSINTVTTFPTLNAEEKTTTASDQSIQPYALVQQLQPANVEAKQTWTPMVEDKPFEIRKATTEVSKDGAGFSHRYIVCNREAECHTPNQGFAEESGSATSPEYHNN